MKNRLFGIGFLTFAIAASQAQTAPIDKFVELVNKAEGLRSSFTVTSLNGVAQNYSIVLSKPNMARIDTPEKLIVASGKTITVLYKSQNKYFEKPQTAAELANALSDDAVRPFQAFYDAAALKSLSPTKLADTTRKGAKVTATKLLLDAKAVKSLTLFLDKSTSMIKQGQIDAKSATSVIDFSAFEIAAQKDTFAFNPPKNSEKVDEADLVAMKWYTSLDEALAIAQKTNRPVLIDFFATWCGPCKMLESDVFTKQEFKDWASGVVLCRIDVDAQPDVAKKFEIEAMPTTIMVDKNGNELGRFVGFVPLAEYMSQVRSFGK